MRTHEYHEYNNHQEAWDRRPWSDILWKLCGPWRDPQGSYYDVYQDKATDSTGASYTCSVRIQRPNGETFERPHVIKQIGADTVVWGQKYVLDQVSYGSDHLTWRHLNRDGGFTWQRAWTGSKISKPVSQPSWNSYHWNQKLDNSYKNDTWKRESGYVWKEKQNAQLHSKGNKVMSDYGESSCYAHAKVLNKSAPIYQGTLLRFDFNKNCGAIDSDGAKTDFDQLVYVHGSVLQSSKVSKGDEVCFILHLSPQGKVQASRPLLKLKGKLPGSFALSGTYLLDSEHSSEYAALQPKRIML